MWQIAETFAYPDGADRSGDVEHGFRFELRHDDGRTGTAHVEAAAGAPPLDEADARRAVEDHLAAADPPFRLVYGTDGRFVLA